MSGDLKMIEGKLRRIRAVDIMSRFAITTKENESVTNLAHLMMRFKISGVPVVDKNGRLSGIVTATDLFELMRNVVTDIEAGVARENYAHLKVSQIMKREVVSITEEAGLYEIAKIMCMKNIHTIPVMDLSQKEMIGVIGRRDVINAFYSGISSL